MDIAVPSLKYYNFKNELFQIHTHYSKELTTEEDQGQLQILLKKKENKKFLFRSISKITKHFDEVERCPVANDEIYLLFEKRPVIQDKNITFLRNNKQLKLDQNRYHFAIGILTEEMKKQIQSSSETETDTTGESDINKESDEKEQKEQFEKNDDESEESDDNATQTEESKENQEKDNDKVEDEESDENDNEESKEEEGEKDIDNNEEKETIDLIQTPRKKKGGFVHSVINFAKYISPWKRGEDNLPKTEQKKKEELEKDLERKRTFQENSEEESENEQVIVNCDNDEDEDENEKKEIIEQKKKRKKIIDNESNLNTNDDD
ncbi:hypothetical protein M0813_11022 [Anaeramoeba flamelloides]|uniref:Uncharacterized protein n=1 Tax=Anaeramoeba flamelloides TaxID=1746091 RepID=A0ABQ8X111_9EUKA|nr:hypothetical protein M0813_11022 [Anaeramoeba flamelloides]